MSNTIQIKRSSTASSVPTAGQLAQGELAVNLVDKKLYTKDNTNTVIQLNPEPPPAVTIASTAEAQAGTNNTNVITPLRMREGFNASGSAPVYACRAWVSFDGTTSPGTIRASGNVSSVTKNSTGNYTVNFTTAMPDNNYAAFIAGFNAFSNFNVITAFGSGYNVGSVVVLTGLSGPATAADFPLVNVSVFR
jgi:hypothetical protein